MEENFYDFKAVSLQGKEIPMETYRGKMVLIVNTASQCGFTPQLTGLEALHKKYGNKGLVVLGFPCNQFGNQEPGNEASIAEGCVINYGVTFQMFSKVNVNEPDTHPLYKFLKAKQPGFIGKRIKWNFTKFLVDRQGNPVKRFASYVKPEIIDQYLQKVLD